MCASRTAKRDATSSMVPREILSDSDAWPPNRSSTRAPCSAILVARSVTEPEILPIVARRSRRGPGAPGCRDSPEARVTGYQLGTGAG
jgi:hypothetical protein